MQPLGRDIRELLGLLDKHGVRFLIVGGFAVALHGVPRYTKDLDVWLECSADNAARVILALDEFGFDSLGLTAKDFETADLVIQLGYEPNRVDLLTGLTGVSFADAYPKRVWVSLDDLEVPFVDKQTLATNKRAFGRPQDILDAEALEK